MAAFDPWAHVVVSITSDEIRVEPCEDDSLAEVAMEQLAVWLVEQMESDRM
jgi:hypothetical protein